MQQVFDRWDEFRAAVATRSGQRGRPFKDAELLAPSPFPRQSIGVGFNYDSHVSEVAGNMAPPAGAPLIFAKFASCVSGPYADIELVSDTVDFEVELVAVIGRTAINVTREQAWEHVAGVMVGQDISERCVQQQASPQHSIGKSYRTFGPTGPWLTTIDELPDPDDLSIECEIDGTMMQRDRTRSLIFDVSQLIAMLSAMMTLLPGDVIFTGTPSGVGALRTPPRYLREGEVLTSSIEGLGSLSNRIVRPTSFGKLALSWRPELIK
jgi:2-keto-4-pentenoate hydratase/2-oxohepta-3-ene-1,7-dioic acid hydratase in catechol pathway